NWETLRAIAVPSRSCPRTRITGPDGVGDEGRAQDVGPDAVVLPPARGSRAAGVFLAPPAHDVATSAMASRPAPTRRRVRTRCRSNSDRTLDLTVRAPGRAGG